MELEGVLGLISFGLVDFLEGSEREDASSSEMKDGTGGWPSEVLGKGF